MILVKCLYCDADNDPQQTAGYCDACGKKLPPASGFRRRRAAGGGEETIQEAARPRRQTAEAVFTAAVLALIGGGLFLVLGPVLLSRAPERFAPAVMLLTVLGTAWNGLLGLWARAQPRPAALVALVTFCLAWGALTVVVAGWPEWVGLPAWAAVLTLAEAPVLAYLVKAVVVSGRDRV
jgi:hypothetical protein